MQGSFLILTFIALAIVGLLTLKQMKPSKTVQMEAKQSGVEVSVPKNIEEETRKELKRLHEIQTKRMSDDLPND